MHNKKWSQGFKRLVSIGAITIMIVPSTVQAATASTQKTEQIRNNYQTILDKSNVSASKIDKSINLKSKENISVIVEFNNPALAQSQTLNKKAKVLKNDIQNEHKEFKSFLNKMKKEKSVSNFEIKHEYENVYNGMSLNLKGTEVEKLLESKVVKKIWNNNTVQIELPKEVETKGEVNPKMNDSVPHIGVDKLHKEGLEGEGIKVGVLDTGVDYNHPDLKENYKGGYDFVDDDNDPMETTYDDWKKAHEEEGAPEQSGTSNYYTSHGTHVAGTILGNASNNTENKVLGVAPKADLYAYRVLGPYGSGGTAGIIAAIEKSVNDGMDVINLSLGSNINDPDDPLSTACNNSMLAGVVTVVANGNAGPDISSVGTPAASSLAISVGASSTSIQLETFAIKTSAGSSLDATIFAKDYTTNLEEFSSKEYSVVDCNIGSEEDYEKVDVKGKIALVRRGEFPLSDKAINAKKAGAVGMIIYNSFDGPINAYVGEGTENVTSVEVDKVAGEKIVQELKNNENYTVKLNITGKVGTEGDKLADFSSRGPVRNGEIKPDIVAPGVNVRSTYPVYINDKENQEDYTVAYARISGTSMASPHIAGVAALMVEDKNDNKKAYTPEDIKLALMNTADDLDGDYGVNEMGAGRVDAYEAVHPGITIVNNMVSKATSAEGEPIELEHRTGSMSFGIVEKNGKTQKVSDELIIKNNTNKTNTFDVSVDYVSPNESHGGLDAQKNGVKLDTKKTIVASKNKETKLGVNLIFPKDAEEGLYQGYINLQSNKNKDEKYQIPFSVKYLKGGIDTATIDRPAINPNPEMYDPWMLPNIPGTVSLNSEIERLDIVVKDFKTKEDMGYSTSYPGNLFIPGIEYDIGSVITAYPSIYAIKESGEVESTRTLLKQGQYIVEFRATEKDGSKTSREFPLLIDGEHASITLEQKPGIYEITEADFTEEMDELTGETYNAYWVKGNINDNGLDLLREMGLDVKRQHNKVSCSLNGIPQPAFNFHVDDDGNFKIGITKEDLDKLTIVEVVGVDIATNRYPSPPKFKFIREGTPYMNLEIDEDVVKTGDDINAQLSLNNIEKISNIKTAIMSMSGVDFESVEFSKEFKAYLDERGYEAKLSQDFSDDGEETALDLEINISDKDGKAVNISMDGNILDLKYKLKDDHNISKGDLFLLPKMYMSHFKDKNGENVKITTNRELYDTAKVNRLTSSVDIINIIESVAFGYDMDAKTLIEKYIWVEDTDGKRHDVKFYPLTHSYVAKELEPSEEEYTMIFDVPGHFRKIGKFRPGMRQGENVYGKFSIIDSDMFNGVALAGDTNKDGVIDIVDAKNMADVYKSSDKDKIVGMDLDFDGVVDEKDMFYVVENFLKVNEQDENAKKPEETINGKTLDDILKQVGYKK